MARSAGVHPVAKNTTVGKGMCPARHTKLNNVRTRGHRGLAGMEGCTSAGALIWVGTGVGTAEVVGEGGGDPYGSRRSWLLHCMVR